MNYKKPRVRITKPGDFNGRVGKLLGEVPAENIVLIKLKNKTIKFPLNETNFLKQI